MSRVREIMQTRLLVGPPPLSSAHHFPPFARVLHQRIRRKTTVMSAASENHYAVLGVARNATQGDIKRAYRLLARKFHPDVNRDSAAGELFKTLRSSYQVLSNEATRIQYDRALSSRGQRQYTTPEVRDDMKDCYSWADQGRYPDSPFYCEEHGSARGQRDSVGQVVKSACLSMFLLCTLGSLPSLTFSTLSALVDKELDMGYKLGFMIAWILGGKGGILLTLCLTFASWLCGKASSSLVVLVLLATWVGSSLARHAPLPQGALLTLLYMSIKLQVHSS